ncbi:MAG: radical SAM protein [Deltaproteobacteria bacterium]|nr:radical SAM protein [Deltaproteobacteria bacterium]MBW1817308.1 radical SAM protein [Deltaproteobacteria bacterium]
MNVVYEPRGRAREYSELACNLYLGCTHGCRYCYAPACMRTTGDEWHAKCKPRNDILRLLDKDARRLHGDQRFILFSFLSDPYQPLERTERLTRQALEIMAKHRLNNQVLTKGDADLILEDMELMKLARTQLGVTLCFVDDDTRRQWEPRASTVDDRLTILKKAHKAGIFTWVSLEPVINPEQALEVIRLANPYVNFWKIGKLNHMKEHEQLVDWEKFVDDVEDLLIKLKSQFYIKKDLRRFSKQFRDENKKVEQTDGKKLVKAANAA